MKGHSQNSVPFTVGDRVHWCDPDDGLCSGDGTIAWVYDGGTALVNKDDGGEVEAFLAELSHKEVMS